MAASAVLAAELGRRIGSKPVLVGIAEPALAAPWDVELAAARPALLALADQLDVVLSAGRVPVTAMNRCAVGLATLPVVARHRPDVVVVWLDAHADLQTPATTTSAYLGGMALSGPLRLWDSGLGAGLDARHALLVGTRDVDPAEQVLLDSGLVALVGGGPDLAGRVAEVVGSRPVYVHLDCDVLEPGTVPTDYRVADGLSLDELAELLARLAENEVVGWEVGEPETGATPAETEDAARRLVDALDPLLGVGR